MKLTDKIHLLKIDFEIILGPDKRIGRFVNVILVFGEKITLIDTGVKGSEKVIFDYLEQQNRHFSEIGRIILSHSHPDHIGSAASIKELTNCEVLAHELEKDWIEDLELQNRQRPVPGFYNLVSRPVKIDTYIDDNQIMTVEDGISIRFTKSPGHSKGMLNMLFIEDRILFTADSIPLKNDIPNYDNYIELMESFEKIKNNNAYQALLTSWTPPLTDKSEIVQIFNEGEKYMTQIDVVVKKHYSNEAAGDSLDKCKQVVEELNLPAFMINPIVDKAFRSHLR